MLSDCIFLAAMQVNASLESGDFYFRMGEVIIVP